MRQWVIAGVLILTVAVAGTARAEIKLAYVDMQRALNECEAGKRARAEFRGRVERVQAKLQKQQAEVQALKNEIQQKGMLMKNEERQNLEDQYTNKLRDFQQSYKNSRDELEQKDNEMTGAIVRDLAEVVRTLGEERGYTLVMEKSTVLWGAPAIDITDEVIRRYDAMHVKPGSLAPPPGAARKAAPGGGDQLNIEPGGGSRSGRSTITK